MVNIQSYLYELFSKRTTENKISNCHVYGTVGMDVYMPLT